MALAPELHLTQTPDRLIMAVPGLAPIEAYNMANAAANLARSRMPKVTGRMASRLRLVWGEGYFGVRWLEPYTWYQEQGIRPFTMRSLAGKTIPMWIEDPTGVERQRNPKAKVRITEDGRTQVLIFRRAANIGQRRTAKRKNRVTGAMETVSVPMSYPGAPGRIGRREAAQPYTTPGRTPGAIARGNVGVRWRHPGITARQAINSAISDTAISAGLFVDRIHVADEESWAAHGSD